MNIGQLAREAGVPIDTVRYYERQHLLPTAARSAGGYRIFGQQDLRRLRFIRRAKALGFSLEEIAELLALSDRHAQDMGSVRDTARARLADIEQRMVELQRMQAALSQLVDACPGHGALEQCPILAALTEDNA
ncbi:MULTISPECIES: heavy metal-responsive transcriptional regulator [Stenotrophomonas]|uniref:heavy metal-responsive transcriptional regulator n=1 Tax=Stenotrophomonas TaxID=40323 RepID=UPI000D540865|nr:MULTISPECIES: heavy metal-responsive transcriptional regulator [Stenotrophomonas]AWH29493.1 heavy metal-responsive transcriptional regulator [Stenotrophomonas sp. YAU14A_MKIMI4_1]AWH33486.1 heavy metal-responsive transcriptional regulator [Stenotrophomonas sp. SAU14A_NAIMI4_8]MBK0026812.1 heavy metal-responsive transcriptional regulator [Stenotrophomonas sp. S48]MBK0048649.1 heavy metal-responsive transcriptional regulator [Stenotrophomonas sp. S49]HAL21702.1 heavy metal-responsive transcri